MEGKAKGGENTGVPDDEEEEDEKMGAVERAVYGTPLPPLPRNDTFDGGGTLPGRFPTGRRGWVGGERCGTVGRTEGLQSSMTTRIYFKKIFLRGRGKWIMNGGKKT